MPRPSKKSFSVRLSRGTAIQLKIEAESKNLSITQIIESALETYFAGMHGKLYKNDKDFIHLAEAVSKYITGQKKQP